MNKETRTWITGVLIILLSQYYASTVLGLKHNGDKLIIGVIVFCYVFCLAISAYGINLILKSINK